MTLIIKYSFIYISGFITGILSPLIYIGLKHPKEFINNIIKNYIKE